MAEQDINERCTWCGEIYAAHADVENPDVIVKVPCGLLKSRFVPKKTLSPVPPSQPVITAQYLFLDALRLIRDGKRVTKLEWNNTNVYGLLKDNVLQLHREDNKFYHWILSESDMDGDDWVVLPEGN